MSAKCEEGGRWSCVGTRKHTVTISLLGFQENVLFKLLGNTNESADNHSVTTHVSTQGLPHIIRVHPRPENIFLWPGWSSECVNPLSCVARCKTILSTHSQCRGGVSLKLQPKWKSFATTLYFRDFFFQRFQRLLGTPSSMLPFFTPLAICIPKNVSFDKMNTNLINQKLKPCSAVGPVTRLFSLTFIPWHLIKLLNWKREIKREKEREWVKTFFWNNNKSNLLPRRHKVPTA